MSIPSRMTNMTPIGRNRLTEAAGAIAFLLVMAELGGLFFLVLP